MSTSPLIRRTTANDQDTNRSLLRLYSVFGMFDTAEAQPRRDHARHAEDNKKPLAAN